MPIPITVPRLGWNMEHGTSVEWLKADGDAVRPGESLFRLEGEKATEEVESFDAGTLSIPADSPKPGDRVTAGQALFTLHSDDESRFGRAFEAVEGAWSIGDAAPARRSLVVERIS